MRCIYIVFMFLVSVSCVNAQRAIEGWGIVAGTNLSDLKVKDEQIGISDDQYQIESNPVLRFQLGIYREFVTNKNIIITPSLLFIKKGYESIEQDLISSEKRDWRIKYSPSYIQLPIDVAYRIPLKNNKFFDVGINIYAAYGIGGRSHSVIKSNGQVVKDEKFDIEFRNKTEVSQVGEYGTLVNYGYSRPLDFGGGIVLNYTLYEIVST